MTRRDLIAGLGAAGLGRMAGFAGSQLAPMTVGPGPQLFIDDYLIAETTGVGRVVLPPTRHPEPVLTSARFGTTQPYLAVMREGAGGQFRIWFNHGPAVWHAVSADGIHWRDPRVAWEIPRGYGVSVVDDRGRDPDPARRFKLANWQSRRDTEDSPMDASGMYVGFSPDGLRWTPGPRNPVLPTYPDGWPKVSAAGVGDIVDAFWDPLRKQYACAVKLFATAADPWPAAPRAGAIKRRLVGLTTSPDFLRWEKPARIFVPDEADSGLLEFYGMGAVHARGPLLIGLVRVLRDDLPCDPDGPKDGIGYSVLATSRDGKRWERDREPFLDRSPAPGAWDHAMAWASGTLAVGSDLNIYYGGYARGHKIEPEKERQIGLATMKRDRYVARRAADSGGRLLTRPLVLAPGRLVMNAAAPRGTVRARLVDVESRPIRGFDFGDAVRFEGDSFAAQLRWRGGRPLPAGRPVAIEFQLQNADLFGFEWRPRERRP